MVSPGDYCKSGEEVAEVLCISRHAYLNEEIVVFKRITDGRIYHLSVNDFLYKNATDKTPNYERMY